MPNQMGKRYVCSQCETTVLVTKGGDGAGDLAELPVGEAVGPAPEGETVAEGIGRHLPDVGEVERRRRVDGLDLGHRLLT